VEAAMLQHIKLINQLISTNAVTLMKHDEELTIIIEVW